MYLFGKEGGGITGRGQVTVVGYRHDGQFVERCGRGSPQYGGVVGSVVDGPIAERYDDDLEFKSFRLVYGHDAYGVLLLRGGERAGGSLLVPPDEEGVEVCRPLVGILQYEVEESLNKDILFAGRVAGEEVDDFFADFIKRFAAEGLDTPQQVVWQVVVQLSAYFGNGSVGILLEIDGLHQIAGLETGERVVRGVHIVEQGDDQLYGGRVADVEGFVGDDVVAVARVGRCRLFVQQVLYDAVALFLGAHQYGDVVQGDAPVLQVAQYLGRAAKGLVFGPALLLTIRVVFPEVDFDISAFGGIAAAGLLGGIAVGPFDFPAEALVVAQGFGQALV